MKRQLIYLWTLWLKQIRSRDKKLHYLLLLNLMKVWSSFGLILYHQMLNAILWSQSLVSSSRAAKPCVSFQEWYRGQEASMWSAVYSSTLQLQFAEGTKRLISPSVIFPGWLQMGKRGVSSLTKILV